MQRGVHRWHRRDVGSRMYARVRRCIRPYSLVLPGHSAGRECATLYRPVYNVCVPMQLWRTRGKQTGEAALNSQLVEYIVWNVLGLTNGVITGNGRLVGIRVTEERERGWRRDSERPHRWRKLYQLSGLERWYRRSRNLYVLAINMRITRYPLNGVGARKRDPISDLQLPPSRFLSNETRFLLLSANDPRFLDLERSRGGKLVRSPLGRGWEDGFPV